MESLPQDILGYLYQYSSFIDFIHLNLVNKHFIRIMNNDFWILIGYQSGYWSSPTSEISNARNLIMLSDVLYLSPKNVFHDENFLRQEFDFKWSLSDSYLSEFTKGLSTFAADNVKRIIYESDYPIETIEKGLDYILNLPGGAIERVNCLKK